MKISPVFLLPTVVLFPLFVLSQGTKKTFEISGTIRGLKNDSIILLVDRYGPDGKRMEPEVLVTNAGNDHFSFKGIVSIPDQTQLQLSGMRSRKTVSVYLEEGSIVIDGNIDSLNYVSVTGTPTNNDMTKAQSFFAPIYERRAALSQELRKATAGSKEYEILAKEQRRKTDSINNYKIQFMETHPSSYMSLSYLYVLQDNLTTEKVERIYNSFPSEIKKTSIGEYIYSKLQANKSVAIGKKAPDFISWDAEGKKVNLSDYKGKYVLLEFWASWCVPCRAQSPHLVKMYEVYKDKGFTILQYSVDVKRDEQKWRDAIKQDGLTWTQISDLTGPGDPVSKIYGVQPIPDNFLISPDGVILGRRLNSKQLEEMLVRTFE